MALSSERDATVVILSIIAITIASTKVIPNVPAPVPRDTRQLVATTSPTEMDTTVPKPNFLSSICCSFPDSESSQVIAKLYSASFPSSPVRTRTTLSIPYTKIFPSPICPV